MAEPRIYGKMNGQLSFESKYPTAQSNSTVFTVVVEMLDKPATDRSFEKMRKYHTL
jgi:hypothetical protein